MNLLGAIGKRPAERNLEKILEELNDPRLVNSILHTLCDFNKALNQLKFVPKHGYRRRFAEIQYRASRQAIDNVNNCPDKVKSHARNSLAAHWKQWLVEMKQKRLADPQELDKSRPDEFDND